MADQSGPLAAYLDHSRQASSHSAEPPGDSMEDASCSQILDATATSDSRMKAAVNGTEDKVKVSKERPTVVRVKRRRTESPLDALMLEVATRQQPGRGLDEAVLRLALQEQPASRKLFRRIDTVSEADLKDGGATEAILSRLKRGRREDGAESSEAGGRVDENGRGSDLGTSGQQESSSEAAERVQSKSEEDGAPLLSPDSAPVFQAVNGSSKVSPLSKRAASHRSAETSGHDRKGEAAKRKRQQELLGTARKEHLETARAARYEQVRVRRESLDAMGELFQLYDVIRVDEDAERRAVEREHRKRAVQEASDRRTLMMNYLPLLREAVPQAAADLQSPATWQDEELTSEDDVSEEEYVYDVFALEEGGSGEDAEELHPVVRVADDLDLRATDGPPSEYDSEDSNDENHPDNDYPEDELEGVVSTGSLADSDLELYADDDEEYDVTAYDESDSDTEDVHVGSASPWAIRR